MEAVDKTKPKKDARTGECVSRTMIGSHELNEEARRLREERLAREREQSTAGRSGAFERKKSSKAASTFYGRLLALGQPGRASSVNMAPLASGGQSTASDRGSFARQPYTFGKKKSKPAHTRTQTISGQEFEERCLNVTRRILVN